jgi:hypothetical protein
MKTHSEGDIGAYIYYTRAITEGYTVERPHHSLLISNFTKAGVGIKGNYLACTSWGVLRHGD